MKKTILFTIVASMLLFSFSKAQELTSTYNSLLQKHVDSNGNVNYAGLKNDESKLDSYLESINKTTPSKNWSKNKIKAFWINAYNAYTLKLIIDNYPVKSINDINKSGKKPWDIAFVKVGGKTYTLNNVEHDILRKKYSDPRIHVGVNCASISCPKLYNKAFTEKNIDSALTMLMKTFINDSKRNTISEGTVQLSEIFNWFEKDFTQNGTLVTYLNKYSKTKINLFPFITYKKYNWNLNKK